MKKKITVFLIATFYFHLANAQLNVQLKSKIERALLSHFNTIGGENYGSPSFRGRAYTFSFIVNINKKGLVDRVTFSNTTKKLDSLISFATIKNRLSKISEFKTVKNTSIVGLVLVRCKQDSVISNFYTPYMRRQFDEIQDFDQYFLEMIPHNQKNFSLGKNVILETFELILMPSIRK